VHRPLATRASTPLPVDHHAHPGLHGAWHDEGRLTRLIAGHHVWAHLARQSVARYADIAEQGGQQFHVPGSVLYVFEQGQGFEQHRTVAEQVGAEFADVSDTPGSFPYLSVPPSSRALLETGSAGIINPRRLVANQLRAASLHGATVVDDVVTSLEPDVDGVVAVLHAGTRLRCRRAVVAAGAYVNSFGLLPSPAPVSAIGITAHFFAVDGTVADELEGMPGMLWFDARGEGSFVYSLPPIRYPDGRLWFKIGGHRESAPLHGAEEVNRWHRSDGDGMGFESVATWVAEHIPLLAGRESHTVGCVITESTSALPMIAEVTPTGAPGRVVAVSGCSGAAAKSCDEIGRIAAVLAVHGEWDSPLDRALLSGC
jgi:sarcosine oxidase